MGHQKDNEFVKVIWVYEKEIYCKHVQVVVTELALGNQGTLTLYYILPLRHTIRLLVTTMNNRLRIRDSNDA